MSVTRHDFRATLLYASTTDSVIPWEWIEESKGSSLFMTERERVEMLLAAVNGEGFPLREWNRLCGAPLLRGGSGGFSIERHPSSQGDPLSAFERPGVPLIDQVRAPLRASLEGIMREPDKAVPEIEGNTAKIVDGKVIRITELSERGVPRDRVIAHSIGAALIFALTLVLDPDRPYRRLLRQCALPVCGRFALGAPPKTRGKPANFYCPSSDHGETHHRQQAQERQAALRAGVSVSTIRRRKLRSQSK